MRVLCQTDGYLLDAIGGIEVLVAALLDELQQRGHDVLVITSCIGGQAKGTYTYQGIELRKFPFGEALQAANMQDIVRLQREVDDTISAFDPDVLLMNSAGPASFFFLRRGVHRSLPRALAIHAPTWPMQRDGMRRRLLQEADVVIAVSQYVANDLSEATPEAGSKLVVIPNSLPLPRLQPSIIPQVPTAFLCFGRVVEDKGMDVAIDALTQLREQGLDVSLDIVGNGPEKRVLRRVVEQRSLGEYVRFHGWMAPENIAGMINRCDAVLVPSRWMEAFGLVALQAAQMGRPVIASAVGGLTEIVLHGETGFTVLPDDPAELARAMKRLCTTPGLGAELGRKARLRAERAFAFDSCVTSYEDALEVARRERAESPFAP